MALIQVNFFSNTLRRTVPIQVILPVDKRREDSRVIPERFKTLYLLHGIYGNNTDWVSGSRIQRWAEERNLAVVMPSGDNSFYVDRPESKNCYGAFVGQELVEITRKMFPLSTKRADTFIGGLSMGGYGAVRNGLKYHDTFGAIISLSGVLDFLDAPEKYCKAAGPVDQAFMESVFGSLDAAVTSDFNPSVLLGLLAQDKISALPKIYLGCGTEDDLLPASRHYRKLFMDAGFDVTYAETPGGHDWDFWDDQILKVLNWLTL